MERYKHGKIYQIVSPDGTKYIGSTIRELHSRFYNHVSDYKNNKHGTASFDLFKKYGIENCKIELIENYPCDSRKMLEKREGEIIKQTLNCINKVIAGRTTKEWICDNIEHVKQYQSKWREDNKEHVKELIRAWNKENRDYVNQRKRQHRASKKS